MSGIRLAGGFTYLPKEYLDTPKIYFQQNVILTNCLTTINIFQIVILLSYFKQYICCCSPLNIFNSIN